MSSIFSRKSLSLSLFLSIVLHSIQMMFFPSVLTCTFSSNSLWGAPSSVSFVDSNPVQLWRCFHLLFSMYVQSISKIDSLFLFLLGSCPVCYHKSSFLILSSHLMPRICHKHLLMHTWILFINVAVSRHASDLYKNTDLTFEEKILSFVFSDREVVCHTGFKELHPKTYIR